MNTRFVRIAAAMLLLGSAAALMGCGGGGGATGAVNRSLPPAVATALQRGTPVDSAIVTANDGFGFSLFSQLAQQSPGQNVFLSPTSVALALEIVYNGAGTTTLQGMAQALQLQGLDVPTLNSDNAALQASLVNPDPKITLTIANSLWYHPNQSQLNPTFVQNNVTYYGSELGDLAGAPDNVNAWINTQTNGTIPTILPAGNYQDLLAIIVNAVYFKGQWTQQFDSTQTAATPFTRVDGSQVTCNMMNQSGNFGYYKGTGFQVIRLPYGSGRMSMIVALPDSGTSWTAFQSQLTAQNLSAWIGQLQSTAVAVGLPRFTLDYGAQLKPELTALGMGVAFDPNNADLQNLLTMTAMGTERAYISFVYHKTHLQVDEQGTVASGGTGVGTGVTSIPTYIPVRMDHPFFCAIRDDKTGELLFLGAIMDPTAG